MLSQGGSQDGTPRKRQRVSTSLFVSKISEGGCRMNAEGLYTVKDPRRLGRFLEHAMVVDSDLRQGFVRNFEEHIQDDDLMRKALMPMVTTAKVAGVAGSSIIRVLLSVPPLQQDISKVLLEKLPEFSDEMEDENNRQQSTQRLIMAQFRWLDNLEDSAALTQKLLEVLPGCPEPLQKEIIEFIPEVIMDENHEMVVQRLSEKLEEDSTFVVSVLDAFANLNLEGALQQRAVEIALGSLGTAGPEDLPVVVRFVLQAATKADAVEVVRSLRHNLNFLQGADVRAAAPDRKGKGRAHSAAGQESVEAIVLDAIQGGLRYPTEANVAEVLLKEIRAVTKPEEHKVVDVWALLVLHSIGGPLRKGVEAVLKRKLLLGHCGEELLRASLLGRESALRDYFPTLLSVAEAFTRTGEEAVRNYGGLVYVLAFRAFPSSYHRQEVLGSLLTHTGAGAPGEVAAAMSALLKLAKEHIGDLLPMASFVAGLLDHLANFADRELHQVFELMSELAVGACTSRARAAAAGEGAAGGGGGRVRMEDELRITIRKQLSRDEAKFKRIGIVGAVTFVCRLASAPQDEADPLPPTEREALNKEATDMLHELNQNCRKRPEALALLYDELAAVVDVHVLDAGVLQLLADQITQKFEATFLSDLDKHQVAPMTAFPGETEEQLSQPHAAASGGETWLNLDGDTAPVVVRTWALLEAPKRAARESLVALGAHMRLMQALERRLLGSLHGIDAVLGCPVHLVSAESMQPDAFVALSPARQEAVVAGLVHTINWFRELLSAFATQLPCSAEAPGRGDGTTGRRRSSVAPSQEDTEPIEAKLLMRLRSLCHFEAILDELLGRVPGIQLPQAGETILEKAEAKTIKATAAGAAGSKAAKGGGKKGGGQGKKRKKPAKGGEDEEEREEHEEEDDRAEDDDEEDVPSTAAAAAGDAGAEGGLAGEWGALPNLARHAGGALRPLRPTALAVLGAAARRPSTPGDESTDAHKLGFCRCCEEDALLPAKARLVADLVDKLRLLKAKKRLPWAASGSSISCPPGTRGMTTAHLMGHVVPLFGPLRSVLERAVDVTSGGAEAASQGNNCDHLEVVPMGGEPAGTRYTAAVTVRARAASMGVPAAAAAAVGGVLEAVRAVLSWHELTDRTNAAVLPALLGAFADPASGSAPPPGIAMGSEDDLASPAAAGAGCLGATLLERAFTYFDQMASQPDLSFEHTMLVLQVMEGLVERGAAAGRAGLPCGATDAVASALRARLSGAAERALKADWVSALWARGVDDWDKPESRGGAGPSRLTSTKWKGVAGGKSLEMALHMYLRGSASPIDAVAGVAATLTKMDLGKGGARVCAGKWHALSPGTLALWCRVLYEEARRLMERCVVDPLKPPREKKSGWELPAPVAEDCLDDAQGIAGVLKDLTQLVKDPDAKTPVLSAALRGTGKVVETFMRSLPAWGKLYQVGEVSGADEDALVALRRGFPDLCRTLQKSTRTIHILCNEAKAKRNTALLARVPQVKRTLERFVQKMKEFSTGNAYMNIKIGNLKNKNLGGEVVPSQLPPQDEEEEEEEDGGSEGGGSDEEDEDEGEDEDEE